MRGLETIIKGIGHPPHGRVWIETPAAGKAIGCMRSPAPRAGVD